MVPQDTVRKRLDFTTHDTIGQSLKNQPRPTDAAIGQIWAAVLRNSSSSLLLFCENSDGTTTA